MIGKKESLLNNQEKEFINELQGLIGETIKPKTFRSKAPHMFSGYFIEDGRIKELTMYDKNLRILPDSICNLFNLQKLYLGKNELFTLPESIGNLRKLEILSVNRNKMEKIPDSVCNLKHLKILTLAGNNLTYLPEEIGRMESLEVIFVQDNNLLSLPESISDLTNLASLYLYNNPQLEITESIKKMLSTMEEKGTKVVFIKEFTLSEVPSLKKGADPIFMTDMGMFTYKELMDDPLLQLLAEDHFKTHKKKK